MWKCCSCFTKTYEAPEVLELDYRHSSLTEVPADVFGFERTLEKLDLGSNQISDLPPSLFHCHELKELDLCDNDLMSIPPAVGSLTRLCRLDLSRNGITDIADAIKNCKNLVYFDLSMNHLTKLPEGISQLVNLEELFLNDTYLEFLHANFGRLTKLKVLEIRENSIQSLPKSMSRLHHLQRLDIGQNDMSELPEVIGTMTNLTELWGDNNNLRSIPKFIGNLTKLNCLDFSQNEIQDVAEEISKCTQLDDITLNTNSLEHLPDSFVKLESLTVLRLDSNSIQYLPEEFGNLKNLQELSIVSNSLKKLPASIGLLRKLHTLYLDDNFLSELPKEIGSCSSLSVFSVAKNQLKEIPSEIGHLSSLKVFTLSGNLIIHLPVSILNIQKLGALWLSASQSKPLLQLNKEIDPASGQHVLTCYLLPQLPSNEENKNDVPVDGPEEPLPPRRSRPSIKFMTDVEPMIVENSVSKRGLLRAPTPYPKELRALAKHASHLRQSKELNGELVNTDEPEYEGDFIDERGERLGGGETSKNGIASKKPLSVHETSRVLSGNIISPSTSATVSKSASTEAPKVPNHALSTSQLANKQEGLNSVGRDTSVTVGLPPSLAMSNCHRDMEILLSEISKSSSQASASKPNLEDTSLRSNKPEIIVVENQPSQGTRFSGLPDVPDKSSRESYGSSSSELARKSPPPYHVAARRAAFFRSSGGAGGVKIGGDAKDLQQPLMGTVAPLLGVRMFPPSTSDSASNAGPVPPGSQHAIGLPQDASPISSVSELNSTFTRNDVFLPNSAHNRWDETKGESDQLLGNEQFLNVDDGGANSHLQASSTSKFDTTYVVSADADSVSDVVSSSVEENTDDMEEVEKALDENILDESEVELRSKSFVETIETALESVDKRTTEFLRYDKWEPESSETVNQINPERGLPGNIISTSASATVSKSASIEVSKAPPNNSFPVPSFVNKQEELNNAVGRDNLTGLPHPLTMSHRQSDMDVLLSDMSKLASHASADGGGESENLNFKVGFSGNVKRSGIVPPGSSLKGPVPPPKPSPLLSRNLNPGINLASESHNSSYAGVSKVDSYTKIPLFSNAGASLNLNKPSNNEVAATIVSSSQTSRIVPVSSVIHTTVPLHRNYEIATSGPVMNSTSPGTAVVGGSRIPSKLPSLTNTSSTSVLHSTSISKPHDGPSAHPKTEIAASKAVSDTRVVSPSRIPSFGSGDVSVPHNPKAGVPLTSPVSLQAIPSGIQKQIPNPPTSVNVNANPYNQRMGYGTSKVSASNLASSASGIVYSSTPTSTCTTKIPKFGESPIDKQEVKRSTSGTRIPKFFEPSISNISPVSPAPSVSGSDTNPPEITGSVSENNNGDFSSLSNIPSPGGNSISSSKIPGLANRKPWIFGTHKNARVVPVEFRKINDLGFSISDGAGAGQISDAQGIYIISTDNYDSTVKIGDKILQIDGIDVSNMGVEIVRKILGNCQENINLLVSRQS